MLQSQQRPLKVLISGACEAGKFRFIGAVSRPEPSPTNVALRGLSDPATPMRTVGMNLGRLRLDDGCPMLLFATAERERCGVVRDMLETGVAGVVFVVDSTRLDQDLERTRWMLSWYRRGSRELPMVVCADKQDLDGAAPPDRVRRALGLEEGACVIGTSVERATHYEQALQALVCQVYRETDSADTFVPESLAV